MSKTFKLSIVTPERQAVSLDADSVILPGLMGSFGVLAEHAPMLTALKPGVVKVEHGNVCDLYACAGGFAEVAGDKLVVLADGLEAAGDIDADRAKKALQRAEERLAKRAEGIDLDRAQKALERARARLVALESQLASAKK